MESIESIINYIHDCPDGVTNTFFPILPRRPATIPVTRPAAPVNTEFIYVQDDESGAGETTTTAHAQALEATERREIPTHGEPTTEEQQHGEPSTEERQQQQGEDNVDHPMPQQE